MIDGVLLNLGIPFERDVPLAPLTWYGLGGPARILARPRDADELQRLRRTCLDTGTPLYVLGRGANLLVHDAGVDGVVVRLDAPAFRRIRVIGTRVTVGGGHDLMKLVLRTARAGLAGLAGLAGIPATVGGAVRMNAGGRHGEIGDVVAWAEVMDERGRVARLDRAELGMAYRSSAVGDRVVLDVHMALIPGDPLSLREQVKAIFAAKRAEQPLAAASAGCAFRNPPSVPDGLPASAGALIDQAGLKGLQIGGAEVAKRHANFIIAHAGATAADVTAVLEHVEQVVLERFGVRLVRELVVWP